jgi:hypothetical protein
MHSDAALHSQSAACPEMKLKALQTQINRTTNFPGKKIPYQNKNENEV